MCSTKLLVRGEMFTGLIVRDAACSAACSAAVPEDQSLVSKRRTKEKGSQETGLGRDFVDVNRCCGALVPRL